MKAPTERLARLDNLDDRDSVGFVLALHSFMEECAREALSDSPAEGFVDILQAFTDRLRGSGRPVSELNTLSRILREHMVASAARDGSRPLDPEETLAATHNFLVFCRICGIDAVSVQGLSRKLRAWNRTRAPEEGSAELRRIQLDLVAEQADTRRLLDQTARWAEDKQRIAELDGEIMRLGAAREREGARPDAGREPLDEIREELRGLESTRRDLVARLGTYRDLDLYVDNVSRFSLYTRTRMDYERGVMRLTPEQEEAVEAVRPGHDFLIRGGAGTGKTIVLLHALERLLKDRASELGLQPGGGVLFLTYTSTLVKFDRYVAEILRQAGAGNMILTAESFFQSRLKLLGLRQRVDYGVAHRLAEKLNTTGFFTPAELAVEIEEFIFGSLVTREEYIDQMLPRRGMRQPLAAPQRGAVWDIRDRMAREMEHDGVWSKNYSRVRLVEHLRANPRDELMRDLDVALIDESQDLAAADLAALKLMARRGLVMAGDAGQSIYGAGSPYRRAGIDVAGRSRILRTSFRSTVAIQELAEAYRRRSGLDEEEGAGAAAFRVGPIPELYTAARRDELARLLLRKAALFIERLGYDPENLTVLAPTKSDLATLGDALGHAGYRYANIRDEEFSFKDQNTIRLSTLHSSKGLDFPVVLLYLPALPPRVQYEERSAELLARNLIYVAMTRAMDNLNVFTLEGAHDGQHEEPLQDLVLVFREYQRKAAERGFSTGVPGAAR